jgi:putative phosphonate metabolism protein
MDEWRRHAIYFAPREGSPLARFGAEWLGWDAAAGVPREGPDLPGLPRPRADLVAGPDRYGFHATLKPPFRLAEGRDRAELEAAIAALAARHAPFALELGPGVLHGFVALMETVPARGLEKLAAACVTGLDAFRAPPTAEDLARHGTGLDPAGTANLHRWGYPWVLDRFRFHMTLTRALPPADAAAVLTALVAPLTPILSRPVRVSDICHFAEGEDGRFRILRRYPLTGRGAAPAARDRRRGPRAR